MLSTLPKRWGLRRQKKTRRYLLDAVPFAELNYNTLLVVGDKFYLCGFREDPNQTVVNNIAEVSTDGDCLGLHNHISVLPNETIGLHNARPVRGNKVTEGTRSFNLEPLVFHRERGTISCGDFDFAVSEMNGVSEARCDDRIVRLNTQYNLLQLFSIAD